MVNFIIQQPFYFHWGTLQRIQRTERWDLVAGHLNQQQLLHLHPSRNTSLCSGWTQIRFLFVFTVWWKEKGQRELGGHGHWRSLRGQNKLEEEGATETWNLTAAQSVCLEDFKIKQVDWQSLCFSFLFFQPRSETAQPQFRSESSVLQGWGGGVSRSQVESGGVVFSLSSSCITGCVFVLFCINAVSSVEGDLGGVLLKSQVQVSYSFLCCVCSDIPEDVTRYAAGLGV